MKGPVTHTETEEIDDKSGFIIPLITLLTASQAEEENNNLATRGRYTEQNTELEEGQGCIDKKCLKYV